jgi:hypothetical protein
MEKVCTDCDNFGNPLLPNIKFGAESLDLEPHRIAVPAPPKGSGFLQPRLRLRNTAQKA